jgi:predicted membrane protein DUF2306
VNRLAQRVGAVSASGLSLLVGLSALRYYAPSHALMQQFQVLALERNRLWFLLHIACGIVTLTVGLLQFSAKLRASRPALHRAIGYAYVTGVLLGGIAGLRLSPDTATFLAQGLEEDARMGTLYGLDMSSLGLPHASTFSPSQFFPVVVSFFVLSVAWLVTTGVAFVRIRQRRFADHRAWMIRSYSLTFAAVTVRLAAALLIFLVREPVLAGNLALASWPLNLAVGEWLVRRTALGRA